MHWWARALGAACTTALAWGLMLGPLVAHARAHAEQSGTGGAWAKWWAIAQNKAPSLILAQARLGQGHSAQLSAAPWVGALPEFNLGLGPRMSGGQWDADALVGMAGAWPQPQLREARLAWARALQGQLEAEGQANLWALRQALREGVALAWGAQASVSLAQGEMNWLQEMARRLERRRQVGLGDGIESNLAWAEAANARQKWQAQIQAQHAQKAELVALVGIPLAELPPLILPPIPRHDGPLSSCLARVREQHPSIMALLAAEAEAQAALRMAMASQSPAPTWGLQYAREGAAGSPASYILLGNVGFPWPGSPSDPGAISKAEAQLRERQAAAHAGRLRLEAQCEALWHRAQGEGARLQAAHQARNRAQSALRLLQRSVAAGELSWLQAASVRRSLAELEQAAVQAEVAHQKLWAEWEGLFGPEGGIE